MLPRVTLRHVGGKRPWRIIYQGKTYTFVEVADACRWALRVGVKIREVQK